MEPQRRLKAYTPLQLQVLDDKNLKINVSAVEVYKAWVAQAESETGQSAGLPYNVPLETALEVKNDQWLIVFLWMTNVFTGVKKGQKTDRYVATVAVVKSATPWMA